MKSTTDFVLFSLVYLHKPQFFIRNTFNSLTIVRDHVLLLQDYRLWWRVWRYDCFERKPLSYENRPKKQVCQNDKGAIENVTLY